MNAEQRRRTRLLFEDLRSDLKSSKMFYGASVYSAGYNACYQARHDMLSIALDKLEAYRIKPEGYLRYGLLKTLYLLQSLRDGCGETINKYHLPDDHRENHCHKELTVIIRKIEETLSDLGY